MESIRTYRELILRRSRKLGLNLEEARTREDHYSLHQKRSTNTVIVSHLEAVYLKDEHRGICGAV